jgi:1-acyl-sn-glycerol-3-phosphate acyltransferase
VKNFLRTVALYLFHLGFVRPVLTWIIGVRYRRRSLIPDGPCLVVSNHNSHLDAGVLMSLFPLRRLPRVHPVAAADYFGSTIFKQALAMWMMNGIPIQRRPKPGTDPLQPLVDKLRQGHSLVFFPEGSRGQAGVVARFRPGIGKLVQLLPGLLVVPVYLAGPERIWPRGQILPVPLNINAVVGKPRTYNPERAPREIAEQVQRDVLSLAPPPPPLPGERARPPQCVAVCGLDGTTRNEVVRAIATRLGRHGTALGLGATLLEASPDGVREINAPIANMPHRAWTAMLAKLIGANKRFSGPRFSAKIEIARLSEIIGERRSARFVVTDGSALVDLSAWAVADSYRGVFDDGELNRVVEYLAGKQKIPLGKWWSFFRRAPEVWLVNEWSLIRPPIPTVLVLILPPVAHVMRVVRSSGEPLEAHHNEEGLERLRQGYRRMGELLRRRHRVIVVEFDPTQSDVDAFAETVEHELLGTEGTDLRSVPGSVPSVPGSRSHEPI